MEFIERFMRIEVDGLLIIFIKPWAACNGQEDRPPSLMNTHFQMNLHVSKYEKMSGRVRLNNGTCSY